MNVFLIFFQSQQSSQEARTTDTEEGANSPMREFLESSSSTSRMHHPGDFRVQQKDLLEKLKEQFTNFPFGKMYPEIGGAAQTPEKIHAELLKNDFPVPPFSSSSSHKPSMITAGRWNLIFRFIRA